ncbi:MAG: hypothetical protein M3Z05_17790 [Gemmatimonadota bacterium]|nr:hypothetical protein [Gemmatimonadota bacterium]
MLIHLAIALLQAAPQAPAPAPTTPPVMSARDSSRARRDSIRAHREKKPPKRLAVTPDHLASAFKDPAAREILALARQARSQQDSALQGYDATTYQRVSAGMGFTKFGRDRLAFRTEQATHVRWRRGVGAYIDVTGSRTVVPIAGKSAHVHMDGDISPIPYFPGSETLWIGSGASRGTVDENEGIIHPLAEGAEAYYTYATGDSVTFRMPDGKAIRLRELRVRPRTPKWNLAVGSLWFDLSGGQLVRAAYRMSVPMDIKAVAEEDDSTSFGDVPAIMKPMLFPMTASVSAIGVEYGLYHGRFWLPRVQVLEGGASMSFVRVPFKLEQKFEYDNVNGGEKLAAIVVPPDSGRRRNGTEVGVTVGPESASDSVRKARRTSRRKAACDSSGMITTVRQSRSNPNPVMVRVPCDSLKLANSPDLPASIYDKGDEVFSSEEMDALVSQALSMGAQSDFAPQPVQGQLENLRYNRVEGLSIGGRLDQTLGAGYSLFATGRLGIADLEPNVELNASRSDLQRTLSVTAYNRLTSASDWGRPFGLGASISAFLFGRDEGFYYRASGVELGSSPDQPGTSALTWSLFAEQERTARQKTTFSLARVVHGSTFEPNLEAHRAVYLGGRTRRVSTFGLDPQGFRLFSDARLESAWADTGAYGRAALDLTASHGIGNGAAALTLAAGSSVGVMPTQRFWYLGGTQTVRGQRPGLEAGNAFWLGRAELAQGVGVVRPVVFADLGWAGDRGSWSKIGVPMSGAGAGMSIMDGLIRFDVARGINPERHWRVDTYIEARF